MLEEPRSKRTSKTRSWKLVLCKAAMRASALCLRSSRDVTQGGGVAVDGVAEKEDEKVSVLVEDE